jgi:hypothetical protein
VQTAFAQGPWPSSRSCGSRRRRPRHVRGQRGQHIATFDDLDFSVFSGQQWHRLHRSHAKDIVVHWPGGHSTNGVEKHIEDLKAMFVYAPATRIKVHPVKSGSGEWTSVIGVMDGTFTKPMSGRDGKMIPPTATPYMITMCTVGRWKDGVMVEEDLFWDNLSEVHEADRARPVTPRRRMTMDTFKVGYFVGSLAKASINRGLALVRLALPQLALSEIAFGDLPLHSYDYDAHYPPVAKAFNEEIAAVDAVLFVTPEYNRPIPMR